MSERIVATRKTHRGWFDVSRVTIETETGERFDRGVVEHPTGAALLAYDPARRVAMLTLQTRAPLLLAGADPVPEPIAGKVEDEAPADCVIREALEEAGLRLATVEWIATVWATPASSTERVSLFIAPYAIADRVAEGGGLAEEQERIALVEVPLATLAADAAAGRILDHKTLTLVLTLRLRRPELFVANR